MLIQRGRAIWEEVKESILAYFPKSNIDVNGDPCAALRVLVLPSSLLGEGRESFVGRSDLFKRHETMLTRGERGWGL